MTRLIPTGRHRLLQRLHRFGEVSVHGSVAITPVPGTVRWLKNDVRLNVESLPRSLRYSAPLSVHADPKRGGLFNSRRA